uniref:Nucleoporin NUP53 n=1 Tax=Scleropages formosus TaxID=113540 RepID=A0A8D0CM33_SCLFO
RIYSSLGSEPMTLGSPTSPKPTSGAQFLPGFLMGDLPAPVTPQPRAFTGTGGGMDVRSPLLAGGSPPQPVVPTPKDKSGAPPVRSIYDELASPGIGMSPLSSRKQPFSVTHTPLSGLAATPGTMSNVFSPVSIGQQRKSTLSPAQADPFYTQGEALSSEDQLDDTWVTVFGFPPASASYILLQFAQYGNILKHVVRAALYKDIKFDCAIFCHLPLPCQNVMEGADKASTSSSSVFTPPVKAPGTPNHPVSTPRSAMRPLSAAYKASSSDYQVIPDKQTPRKDDSFVTKAMEYVFGW